MADHISPIQSASGHCSRGEGESIERTSEQCEKQTNQHGYGHTSAIALHATMPSTLGRDIKVADKS